MDIARRVGAETPRSRPVLLLINGTYEGPYELTERLGPEFVEARYGFEDYVLVRTKQNKYETGSKTKHGPEQPYEDQQAFMTDAGALADDLLSQGITAMKIWPFDQFVDKTNGQFISATDLEAGTEPFRKINHKRLIAVHDPDPKRKYYASDIDRRVILS